MKAAALHVPQYLLLPASPVFVAVTVALGFLLNFLPLANSPFIPDFLLLVLVFWNVHQPRKVGIGIAFTLGLLCDVHQTTLLGEHALTYTVVSYLAIVIARRLLWFNPLGQMLHIFPIFILGQLVPVFIHIMIRGAMPGWLYFAQSAVQALCWPLVCWLLLAPQRRAVNRDDNRPI